MIPAWLVFRGSLYPRSSYTRSNGVPGRLHAALEARENIPCDDGILKTRENTKMWLGCILASRPRLDPKALPRATRYGRGGVFVEGVEIGKIIKLQTRPGDMDAKHTKNVNLRIRLKKHTEEKASRCLHPGDVNGANTCCHKSIKSSSV